MSGTISQNTLIVTVDTDGLQYDITAILKAFCPAYSVRVLSPGEAVKDEAILEAVPNMKVSLGTQGSIGILEILSLPEEVCTRTMVFPKKYSFSIDSSIGAKNSFKLFLYDVLTDISGHELPWGNLTGVRPTKIYMGMMNEGYSDENISNYMISHHKVSEPKNKLALEIAHRESQLINSFNTKSGYSLYIGIPFCPTTCLYCSFTSFPISVWNKRLDEYIDALGREMDYVASGAMCSDEGITNIAPQTVYIGGGTPTSLDEEHLEKLLDRITSTIDMSDCREFTCEAGRPDSITRKKLEIMKRYGVTRISVNPQTMQQKTLDLIGRRTTVEQVIESFYMAREVGFDNINMDIILGLPGESADDVRDTLCQIKQMNPDSLTVHSLAIKRASALNRRLEEIGIDSLNNTDETMDMAAIAASQMDMNPYYMYRQKNMSGNFENTGYAREGCEGLYNILIMEEVQSIVALGAGTVTKRVYPDGRIERCENVKDVALYISKIEEMIDRKRGLFKD